MKNWSCEEKKHFNDKQVYLKSELFSLKSELSDIMIHRLPKFLKIRIWNGVL